MSYFELCWQCDIMLGTSWAGAYVIHWASLQEADDTQIRVAPQGLNTVSVCGVRAEPWCWQQQGVATLYHTISVECSKKHVLLPGCGFTGGQLAQLGARPQAGVQLGLTPLQIKVWAAPHRFILGPRLRKAAVPRGSSSHGSGRGTKRHYRNT